MADFSIFSDSSDESAVEELLSQAMDHSVLEQVAAINCSSFTSDSALPTHLETRFRRLKSVPATNPNAPSLPTDKNFSSSSFNSQLPSHKFLNPKFENSLSDDENAFSNQTPFEKNGLEPKLGSGSGSFHSQSSNLSNGNGIFSPVKENADKKKVSNSKSRSQSFLAPSDSSNLSPNSPSPPKKTGCFWCSPKRVSREKSKENQEIGFGANRRRKDDEFLSDLSIFSTKEKQRILQKALKEEEKINREAEKIVKWAKQASARMNISDIEDQLSESEDHK